MIIVIGTVTKADTMSLIGAPVRRPTLNAQCVHIWRTQGDQIEDFPILRILGIGP